MELRREGSLVPLTPLEFKLLKFMVQNAERVISRDELLNEVWGCHKSDSRRTVDNTSWDSARSWRWTPHIRSIFELFTALGICSYPEAGDCRAANRLSKRQSCLCCFVFHVRLPSALINFNISRGSSGFCLYPSKIFICICCSCQPDRPGFTSRRKRMNLKSVDWTTPVVV